MTSVNSISYVRKLVKIVYEKEKQIEALRRGQRDRPGSPESQGQNEIDSSIHRELSSTSLQLREVTQQLLSMERRMGELEIGLSEEVAKNGQLMADHAELEDRLNQEKACSGEKDRIIDEYQQKIRQLVKENQDCYRREVELAELNFQLGERLEGLRGEDERRKTEVQRKRVELLRLEKETNEARAELKRKAGELRLKQAQLGQLRLKVTQIELKNNIILNYQEELKQKDININELELQIASLREELSGQTSSKDNFQIQHDQLCTALKLRDGHFSLLSEKLKDYQQFAFQICQYIESAHVKHCLKGGLRSSKRLCREGDSYFSRFEIAFARMSQLQQWMDDTGDKLQKILREQQLPLKTLENLSIIARSFEEKLELCDLTQRMERERAELDRNQEQLLDNLQKECEKSELKDRSKLVELDQVREILKVTKQVNRQLMDEINAKEFIISECKKTLGQSHAKNAELKNLKALLGLKN